MPFQHDYRPETFDEFFGNEAQMEALKKQLERPPEKRPFAYLITGPSGCGKTTIAYIIKKALGCKEADFYEIDASDERGIGDIRKVKEGLGFAPIGDIKVVFFDEVHGVTGPAQEAMLKMLEKPPAHAVIIMATTEPEKLKTTTKRRPHIVHVEPLMPDDIRDLLNGIIEAEGYEDYPQEVVNKITAIANGSAGIALKILDSIIDLDDLDTIMKAIETVSYAETLVWNISKILLNSKDADGIKWSNICKTLDKFSGDPEGVRRNICNYFNTVLLNSSAPERGKWICEMMKFFTDNFFDSGKLGLSMACYCAIFYVKVDDIPF